MSTDADDADALPLFDQRNYPRAKATLPGYGRGRSPAGKGKAYPPEIIWPEQVRALLDACPTTTASGLRLRAFIAMLYRTGMAVSEVLSTRVRDISLHAGRESVRATGSKSLQSRTLALDSYALPHITAWLAVREKFPGGLLFCVVDGPTVGREWNAMQTRFELRRLGDKVLERRVNPGSFRFTFAAELIAEQWPLTYMQTQLGLTSAWSFTKLFPRLGISPANDEDVAEIARFRPNLEHV